MRNRILAAQIRYESEEEDDDDDDSEDGENGSENNENEDYDQSEQPHNSRTTGDATKTSKPLKPTLKVLPPFLDRVSVFSITKSFFVYQPYMKRETHHSFFENLCSTKANRNEFLNLLLLIISEGICSKNSLAKIYNFICNKIEKLLNPNEFSPKNYQLPSACLYTNVASQCIDCLSHLIFNSTASKLFFASNHDNLLVVKHKKYMSSKDDLKLSEDEEKCPLNYLINGLFIPIVGEEVTLMDSVTKIIQVTVKASVQLKKKDIKYQGNLMAKAYKLLTSSINLEASTTRGLQQVLMTLLSLKISDPSRESLMVNEFIELANSNTIFLQNELKDLIKNVSNFNNPFGSNLNQLISKMSLSSSSQAILLKCTTSIDFIFFENDNKKKIKDLKYENLEKFYSQMELDIIWALLSEFLDIFEKTYDTYSNVNKISFLLPLLEALMIICKITIYKNNDTKAFGSDQNIAELSKFCHTFISKHKVLLNSMIRTSPKLMNGPFSILLKLDSRAIDFDNKRFYFVNKLKQEMNSDEGGSHKEISVDISRDQVFLDSYRVLFFKPIKEFINSKFNITFQGEQGVDAGGVKREWYQIISRQMVNPDYALFVPVSSDVSTFHPNRTSGINPEHLSFFKFIGMILAKSIRDNCYIDSHFSRAVYKQILGKNVSLKDMESIDPDYYKSLCWILENDITDILDMTFSVETDDYGEHKVIDLIPNGSNIDVTEANKREYVERMINYKLKDSVKEQMDNLIQGFYSVISKENITIFNEKELELLMNGLPEIDVDDWKNNTTYVNYSTTSKEINYFWRAVRSFSKDERAKLLQFITGTSKVPLDGFKQLAGVNGTSKFSIHKDFGSDDRLPQSHTCFNQLDLPSYKSYEDLKRALLIAINEGYEGFGLK
ncbi:HECT-domain-containing protein [Hanseniaspora valbyensis NRRL Y-1626]|uniref:HECT-type E3 ubiquitin transferase n=1 Tax=Hanseniaspora valbyensis NRRL Y-1626 TaxID=766949 RepID=A0A1B7TCS0_9ASCO|nr:HECT-domain-containing protein [Hanseniaspora valbyensis NRRL Y-1626]